MYKILVFVFILFMSIATIFCCMSNTNVNCPRQEKKDIDLEYFRQVAFLNKCIDKHIQDKNSDKTPYIDFIMRKDFIDDPYAQANPSHGCKRILHKHQTKLFICPEFALKYGCIDKILPHVIDEYEQCLIDKKNIVEDFLN